MIWFMVLQVISMLVELVLCGILNTSSRDLVERNPDRRLTSVFDWSSGQAEGQVTAWLK
ncbi:MAG: hypothetical protein HY866_02635 [Chloroflexi bacterium]|nr:hypothetical protein [Chloroflexota bacterium]